MYEIYGLKIGEREVETYRILAGTPQFEYTWSGERITVYFYMWCIKGMGETIMVDTGMEDMDLCMPGREMRNTVSTRKALELFEVDPRDIKTVVISHLHPDHFSSHAMYPNATFWIQKKEVAFWATVPGTQKNFRSEIRVGEVIGLNYGGRVRFVDGDEEVVPGISVALVRGHTPGHQVVCVDTAAGNMVLCLDSVDLYRNINEGIRSKTSGGTDEDNAHSFLAFDKIRSLASSPDLIVPGHDPLVMRKYSGGKEGVFSIAAK